MLSRLPSGKHHTSSANIYTTRLYLSLILCPLSRSSSSLPKSARSSMLNGNTNVGARWETKWTRARDHAVRAVGIITRVSFIAKKEEKKRTKGKGKATTSRRRIEESWPELNRKNTTGGLFVYLLFSLVHGRIRSLSSPTTLFVEHNVQVLRSAKPVVVVHSLAKRFVVLLCIDLCWRTVGVIWRAAVRKGHQAMGKMTLCFSFTSEHVARRYVGEGGGHLPLA